jgi:putative N6-adenine-specific DNA methylase
MKGLAITHKGIEDITSLEISEILGSKIKVKESCVEFDVSNYEDIAKICYFGQSIIKVLNLFKSFKIDSLEDIDKNISSCLKSIKEFITPKRSFAVRALIEENSDFETDEVCIEVADSMKLDNKVDLKNPDVILFVYIYKDNCYIGIDFAGEDLSKRDYRIYTHYEALKATKAYAMIRVADYCGSGVMLDPFCGSGTILIEAAIHAKKLSQNYYSKDKFAFLNYLDIDLEEFDSFEKVDGKIIGYDIEMRHVVAARKNAKIAGVEKEIDFSKVEIEWLDTKFDEGTVDFIITNPPNKSHKNEKKIEKLYLNFFEKAAFILADNGNVTLITKSYDMIKKAAVAKGFKIEEEKTVRTGEDDFKIVKFVK